MTRSAHVRGLGLLVVALAGAVLTLSGGCGDSKQQKSGEKLPEEPSAPASIKLTSPAFDQSAAIPIKYTGEARFGVVNCVQGLTVLLASLCRI